MSAAPAAHVRTFGDGPRPVLALHCMLGHGEVWRSVAEHLPASTLTAPDLLSHGASPDWDGAVDFHDANAQTMARFLPDGQIDLVGHSFGATVALRLAVEHPERIRSLTLIEPVYFAVLKSAAPQALQAHLKTEACYRAAIEARDYERGVQLFTADWGSGVPWESMNPVAQHYLIDRVHLVPVQYPAIFEDVQGVLAPERLRRVEAPVLLVRGDQSPTITADINAALAEALPLSRQATVAGAGHMLPVTHPEETAQAIGGLLEVA